VLRHNQAAQFGLRRTKSDHLSTRGSHTMAYPHNKRDGIEFLITLGLTLSTMFVVLKFDLLQLEVWKVLIVPTVLMNFLIAYLVTRKFIMKPK
jgi:hypothetical protein